MFNTPILFMIFNRPQQATRVFEQIRAIQPRQLFVAADGPRTDIGSDHALCMQARAQVLGAIDWECDVKTLFRESNLGCGVACSQAISWFFEHVNEGIILEDDCLPHPFFFEFCSELLVHYREEMRVMHISGNNFQNGIRRGDGSYYFSAYHHNWGWATWRRAWSKFEFSIPDFEPVSLSNTLKKYGFNRRERNFWISIFESPFETWDYQWGYAVWKDSGLCILPNENLVINIGFGENATHTKTIPQFPEMKYGRIDPMIHPSEVRQDKDADHYSFEHHFHIREPFFRRLKNSVMRNPSVKSIYSKTKNLRS